MTKHPRAGIYIYTNTSAFICQTLIRVISRLFEKALRLFSNVSRLSSEVSRLFSKVLIFFSKKTPHFAIILERYAFNRQSFSLFCDCFA